MKIQVNIDKLLQKKGKTKYWLFKETGISQHNLKKLMIGDTTSIKFENLIKICKALDCNVEDVLKIVED